MSVRFEREPDVLRLRFADGPVSKRVFDKDYPFVTGVIGTDGLLAIEISLPETYL